MINPDLAMLTYLTGQPALTGAVASRIWPGPDLPPDYTPALGPAVLFGVRGGSVEQVGHVMRPSFTFRFYAASRLLAETTHATFHPYLLSARTAAIKSVTLDVVPTFIIEPKTNWPFVLVFYSAIMAAA